MTSELGTARRLSRQRLQALDLPRPFTAAAMAERLAAQRGRPLHLLAWKPVEVGVCGVWIARDDTDFVFYDATATGLHREHIIVHELAHVMWHHTTHDVLDPALIRSVMPELDPSAVRGMFSRSSYSTSQELEAEFLASMVIQRADDLDQAGHMAGEAAEGSDPAVDSLASAMGRRRALG